MPGTLDSLDTPRLSGVVAAGMATLPSPHLATEPLFCVAGRSEGRDGRVQGFARLAGGAVLRLVVQQRRKDGRGWRKGTTLDVAAESVPAMLAALGVGAAAVGVVAALWGPCSASAAGGAP